MRESLREESSTSSSASRGNLLREFQFHGISPIDHRREQSRRSTKLLADAQYGGGSFRRNGSDLVVSPTLKVSIKQKMQDFKQKALDGLSQINDNEKRSQFDEKLVEKNSSQHQFTHREFLSTLGSELVDTVSRKKPEISLVQNIQNKIDDQEPEEDIKQVSIQIPDTTQYKVPKLRTLNFASMKSPRKQKTIAQTSKGSERKSKDPTTSTINHTSSKKQRPSIS